VGVERQDEDQYLGSGPSPKLSLVGRLDGKIDGRPVNLVAENLELVLAVENLRTLLSLRRSWKASHLPIRSLIERFGIRLSVQLRWFGNTEVLPRPNYIISLLLPRE
jgi:hypothetical protein